MGISLGRPISEFKQNMISKGFEFNDDESNKTMYYDTYLFRGRFAGEDVGVSVYVTPHSRIVYCVSVRFIDYNNPHRMTEEALKAQLSKFNEIRESISKKYKIEPYDWSHDYVVKASKWGKTNWSIDLSIMYDTSSDFQWQTIDLQYTDKKAEKKAELEKESDY